MYTKCWNANKQMQWADIMPKKKKLNENRKDGKLESRIYASQDK
jgi:hypothetical protein